MTAKRPLIVLSEAIQADINISPGVPGLPEPDVIASNRKIANLTPARELLAPIYERFTEGLDTRDLVAARELLDSLR